MVVSKPATISCGLSILLQIIDQQERVRRQIQGLLNVSKIVSFRFDRPHTTGREHMIDVLAKPHIVLNERRAIHFVIGGDNIDQSARPAMASRNRPRNR